MAIGDGANDVNMITAAHVGIGIKGVEGHQAARASDYSIGEFKDLQRLLLFYGRECYRKNSYLIFYNFFKNMVLVLPQFWFGFYDGFSGQPLYNPALFQAYNVFFSSLPIIIYAILDKESKGSFFLQNPDTYLQGPQNKLFKLTNFWKWIFLGVFQSALLLFVTLHVLGESFIDKNQGYTLNVWGVGMAVFGFLIFLTNMMVLIMHNRQSLLTTCIFLLSVFLYVGSYAIVSDTSPSFDDYGTFNLLFSSPYFYVVWGIITVVAWISDIIIFEKYKILLNTRIEDGISYRRENELAVQPQPHEINEFNIRNFFLNSKFLFD